MRFLHRELCDRYSNRNVPCALLTSTLDFPGQSTGERTSQPDFAHVFISGFAMDNVRPADESEQTTALELTQILRTNPELGRAILKIAQQHPRAAIEMASDECKTM